MNKTSSQCKTNGPGNRAFCFRENHGIRIAGLAETITMSKIMITATAIGVGIAVLILLARRRTGNVDTVKDAADDAYQTMNGALGSIERNSKFAMG